MFALLGAFTFITQLFRPKTKSANVGHVRTLANGKTWGDIVEAFNGYSSGGTTKAMRVSTVFACIDRKAKDIASLPLRPTRKVDSGTEIARNHDQYFIAKNPSPNYTKYTWLYTLNGHIDRYGECFSPITRKNGRPVEYGIWNPTDVEDKIINGKLYWVNSDLKLTVSDEDMIHVMGYTVDGIRGKSVLSFAADTISVASNGSKLSATLYKNQMWSPGYISYKEELTSEQADFISKNWSANHTGEDNADNIPILDNGSEWKTFGMSLKESEYLGTVKNSAEEICRFYGVPPSKVGIAAGNVSYGSLEQENIAYVQDTILPRVISWEEELNRKAISDSDMELVSFKFELKSRLRGDMAARSSFYQMALTTGLLSINETLRLEDMDTIGPEGDERYINAASVPLSKLFSGEVQNDQELSKLFNGIKTNGNGTKEVLQHKS